jgi:hypothetical protein
VTDQDDQIEQSPELPMPDARAIAHREAFIVSYPFSANVSDTPDDHVQFKVTRMIGGVAREYSAALGRSRSAEEFCRMARQVWKMLLSEAMATRGDK